MKKCNACGEVKDISSFESYKCIKGKSYRRKMCRKCRIGQRRKRMAIKERKIVSEKDLIITDVVGKYMELKSIERVSKFFGVGFKRISKILKANNIQLYINNRVTPEHRRKKLVDKVVNYRRRRLLRDPLFKAKTRMRGLISQVFVKMNYSKKSRCFDILGIEWDGFKLHIESKFKEGMSWENYGEWEYDHIIPVSFAKNEEQIVKLNHYTNFQPLWKEENKIKSNKIL
jgi:hypothetical protein